MKASNTSYHLSDEVLIGLIEGNADKSQEKEHFSHLKTCDKCFLRYSSLLFSFQEIENSALEVTPDSLVDRANKEFYLVEPKRVFSRITEILIEKMKLGYRNLSHILQPKVVTYAVITTFILLLIFIPILFQKEDSISNDDVRKTLETQINKLDNTAILSADESLGIKVNLNNDTLMIAQPFRFKRTLLISSLNGNQLYTTDFYEINNTISLPNDIVQESIVVTISSLDTIIFRITFTP